MRRWQIVGGLAIAAAMAAAWVLFGGGSRSAEPPERHDADLPADTQPSLSGRLPPKISAEEASPVADGPAPPAQLAPKPENPATLAIRFGRGGGPPPASVEVVLAPDRRREPQDLLPLSFTTGAWERPVPLAGCYELRSLRIDGWDSDQTVQPLLADRAGRFDLVIQIPKAMQLTVEDASSGEPLAGVRVYRHQYTGYGGSEEAASPNRATLAGTPLVTDADGHLKLTSATWTSWWIIAAGHAWAQARTTPEQPEVRVPLGPGGGVRVIVDPWGEIADAKVAVEPAGASENDYKKQSEAPPTGEPGHFYAGGLPPGSWRVLVGRRSILNVEDVLASAVVEVVAGRDADTTLHAPPAPREGRFDLVGDVVVPEAWGVPPATLEIRGENMHIVGFNSVPTAVGIDNNGISRTIRLDAEPRGRAWPFRIEGLLEGVYLVTVSPFRWQRYIWIPHQANGLRLEVAPPVELRVRLVDAVTGLPALSGSVHVTPVQPSREPPPELGRPDDPSWKWKPSGWTGGWFDADRGRDGAEFVVTAPAGPVEINASARGYAPERRKTTLLPGDSPHVEEIRMRPSGEVVVRILRGGAVFEAADGDCAYGSDEKAAKQSGTSWPISNGIGRMRDLVAGDYYVRWRHWKPSYAVELKPVHLLAGETATLDFDAPPD